MVMVATMTTHSNFTPLGGHGTEYFDQNGHQRKGGCTFRDNRQVSGNCGRRSLIGVGSPQMERHKAQLKGHTGEEKYQCQY